MSRLILAAERGDAGSQFNLGIFYDTNLDDNHHSAGRSRTESINWLLKAARQSLPRAQSKLAELYADGPDAPKHDVRACAWLILAAKNSTGAHRHRAEVGYARLTSRMTKAQISKAGHLARRWAAKPQDGTATPLTDTNCPKKDVS